jgi:catalase
VADGRSWHPAYLATHERLRQPHLQLDQRGRQGFRIKYHFIADQGIDCLTQAKANEIAGRDADYHQRDLVNAIRRGEYPNWTLKVQIMPFEEANTYRYCPFDLTKVWPHADYPLHEVGKR